MGVKRALEEQAARLKYYWLMSCSGFYAPEVKVLSLFYMDEDAKVESLTVNAIVA